MKNARLLAAHFVALIAISSPAFADIYQWKDNEGKTQYSDQPPPDRPARLVKSGTTIAAAEKTTETADAKTEKKGPKSVQEQDQDFRKRKIEAEKSAAAAAEKAEANKKSCAIAKNNLRITEEGGRTYKLDEKGERGYLDDKGLAKESASTKADISKYCS